MFSFRVLGFPVRVEWFFWVLCLFLGWGYLQDAGPEGLTKFAIMSAIVFASIVWHELGHALARRRFGATHSNIVLHGFGGYCEGPGQFTRGESILISAAGPLANLLVGGATLALIALSGGFERSANPYLATAVFWLIWVNIGWAFLNLLPVYPLDGGQILAHALGQRHYRSVLMLGIVFAVALGLAGFVFLGSIFALVLCGMLAWGNWQRLQGRPGGIF